MGGSGDDGARDVDIDAAGNAYVTGYTLSTNFPTADPIQAANAGNSDAFVTELASSGASVVYSTYLGGSSSDGPGGIAVDGSGSAYLIGLTSSTNFPTVPGSFDMSSNGGQDAL